MHFPAGFFGREDEFDDAAFYGPPRLVTHIDDAAIAAVGSMYEDMAVTGRVLDLMGSWISHFSAAPEELVVLGMNDDELAANTMATSTITHDLNQNPQLPFPSDHFDDVVCVVSVDYLTQPVAVFEEVRRVLRANGRFICTFSNRCFHTKAIRGWLMATDEQRCHIVATYFSLATGFSPATIEDRSPGPASDPLYAVWASLT